MSFNVLLFLPTHSTHNTYLYNIMQCYIERILRSFGNNAEHATIFQYFYFIFRLYGNDENLYFNASLMVTEIYSVVMPFLGVMA